MSPPSFSRHSNAQIEKIKAASTENINLLKRLLRASYAEIDRLQAVIGNASYLICILF